MKKLIFLVCVLLCKAVSGQNIVATQTPWWDTSDINIGNREINHQQAYSLFLDNRLKQVQTYWAIHDIYKERQQWEFDEIKKKRKKYLEIHGLKSLSTDEYDDIGGVINWPKQLQQAQYDRYRLIYSELMMKRAYKGLDMYEYAYLKKTSLEWRMKIISQKDYYPEGVFQGMLRFILKIDREINNI